MSPEKPETFAVVFKVRSRDFNSRTDGGGCSAGRDWSLRDWVVYYLSGDYRSWPSVPTPKLTSLAVRTASASVHGAPPMASAAFSDLDYCLASAVTTHRSGPPGTIASKG